MPWPQAEWHLTAFGAKELAQVVAEVQELHFLSGCLDHALLVLSFPLGIVRGI